MNPQTLSTSEAHTVDLIALRAWHWSASCDPSRDHEMRKWHRDQCKWISVRMGAHTAEKINPTVLAVAELSTEAARTLLHREIQAVCAGDWETNCRLAMEAIAEKLHRPFKTGEAV